MVTFHLQNNTTVPSTTHHPKRARTPVHTRGFHNSLHTPRVLDPRKLSQGWHHRWQPPSQGSIPTAASTPPPGRCFFVSSLFARWPSRPLTPPETERELQPHLTSDGSLMASRKRQYQCSVFFCQPAHTAQAVFAAKLGLNQSRHCPRKEKLRRYIDYPEVGGTVPQLTVFCCGSTSIRIRDAGFVDRFSTKLWVWRPFFRGGANLQAENTAERVNRRSERRYPGSAATENATSGRDGGIEGTKKAELRAQHAKQGIEVWSIKGASKKRRTASKAARRRSSSPSMPQGCETQPTYDTAWQAPRMLSSARSTADEEMVNAKHQRCGHQRCTGQPSYGVEDTRKTGFRA